jgi:hypothetical protein
LIEIDHVFFNFLRHHILAEFVMLGILVDLSRLNHTVDVPFNVLGKQLFDGKGILKYINPTPLPMTNP